MKRLVWITAASIVAIFVIALIAKPKSASVQFAYDKLAVLGDPDAPVKIVEFGDYKCPSCKYFSTQIEPQLKKDFIDKGIASFYFMNFTILGPDSYTAALAGQSIFHQNNAAFWKFYDAVYKFQGDEKGSWATPEFLIELAKKEKISVDYVKLQQDIVSKTYRAEVDEHNEFARKSGVKGTPALFINGKKFDDAFDYNALKKAIEEARKDGQ